MDEFLIPLSVVFVIQGVVNCSLTCRLGYWRQKALNRMDQTETRQAKKTGDSFWSFLR